MSHDDDDFELGARPHDSAVTSHPLIFSYLYSDNAMLTLSDLDQLLSRTGHRVERWNGCFVLIGDWPGIFPALEDIGLHLLRRYPDVS